MAKTETILQLGSFKCWQFGNYTITQYRPFLFIISRENKNIWQTMTLRGALRYLKKYDKANK